MASQVASKAIFNTSYIYLRFVLFAENHGSRICKAKFYVRSLEHEIIKYKKF